MRGGGRGAGRGGRGGKMSIKPKGPPSIQPNNIYGTTLSASLSNPSGGASLSASSALGNMATTSPVTAGAPTTPKALYPGIEHPMFFSRRSELTAREQELLTVAQNFNSMLQQHYAGFDHTEAADGDGIERYSDKYRVGRRRSAINVADLFVDEEIHWLPEELQEVLVSRKDRAVRHRIGPLRTQDLFEQVLDKTQRDSDLLQVDGSDRKGDALSLLDMLHDDNSASDNEKSDKDNGKGDADDDDLENDDDDDDDVYNSDEEENDYNAAYFDPGDDYYEDDGGGGGNDDYY